MAYLVFNSAITIKTCQVFNDRAKYTTPPLGALVLDGRTPLKASDVLILLIILLILLNYIAVKIDKFNNHL